MQDNREDSENARQRIKNSIKMLYGIDAIVTRLEKEAKDSTFNEEFYNVLKELYDELVSETEAEYDNRFVYNDDDQLSEYDDDQLWYDDEFSSKTQESENTYPNFVNTKNPVSSSEEILREFDPLYRDNNKYMGNSISMTKDSDILLDIKDLYKNFKNEVKKIPQEEKKQLNSKIQEVFQTLIKAVNATEKQQKKVDSIYRPNTQKHETSRGLDVIKSGTVKNLVKKFDATKSTQKYEKSKGLDAIKTGTVKNLVKKFDASSNKETPIKKPSGNVREIVNKLEEKIKNEKNIKNVFESGERQPKKYGTNVGRMVRDIEGKNRHNSFVKSTTEKFEKTSNVKGVPKHMQSENFGANVNVRNMIKKFQGGDSQNFPRTPIWQNPDKGFVKREVQKIEGLKASLEPLQKGFVKEMSEKFERKNSQPSGQFSDKNRSSHLDNSKKVTGQKMSDKIKNERQNESQTRGR